MKNIEMFIGSNKVFVPCDFGCSFKHVVNSFNLECKGVDVVDGFDENDTSVVMIGIKKSNRLSTRKFTNAVRRFNNKFINKYGISVHFEEVA